MKRDIALAVLLPLWFAFFAFAILAADPHVWLDGGIIAAYTLVVFGVCAWIDKRS